MFRAMAAILICLSTIPTFSQSPAPPSPAADSPQTPASIKQSPIKSVDLVGLAGIKDNSEGTLTIEDGKLLFAHSKKTAEISAAAIEDVITGDESQRFIRGTAGTISMFGPFASGRFLSLFRSKLDSLTIQYSDADGGLHGAVLRVPVGEGNVLLERDIKGKVWFFGGNLRATYDFAKKATTLTRQNFSAIEGA